MGSAEAKGRFQRDDNKEHYQLSEQLLCAGHWAKHFTSLFLIAAWDIRVIIPI